MAIITTHAAPMTSVNGFGIKAKVKLIKTGVILSQWLRLPLDKYPFDLISNVNMAMRTSRVGAAMLAI